MQESLVIEDVNQLKALADPLRQRLLNAFCCQAATTKQVAETLGEKATRLYHHVDLLEKAGLIELVETRPNRGTLEKYYRASARQLVVDQALLAPPGSEGEGGGAQSLLVNLLQAALADASDRFDESRAPEGRGRKRMVLSQAELKMTEDQAERFVTKMCQLIEECCGTEQTGAGQEYALTVAFFPLRNRPKRAAASG